QGLHHLEGVGREELAGLRLRGPVARRHTEDAADLVGPDLLASAQIQPPTANAGHAGSAVVQGLGDALRVFHESRVAWAGGAVGEKMTVLYRCPAPLSHIG